MGPPLPPRGLPGGTGTLDGLPGGTSTLDGGCFLFGPLRQCPQSEGIFLHKKGKEEVGGRRGRSGFTGPTFPFAPAAHVFSESLTQEAPKGWGLGTGEGAPYTQLHGSCPCSSHTSLKDPHHEVWGARAFSGVVLKRLAPPGQGESWSRGCQALCPPHPAVSVPPARAREPGPTRPTQQCPWGLQTPASSRMQPVH